MTQESRVKKSLLNARINLIFYFLTLILSFFSRKIFLSCLGADFVGLTGTLQNLLGFLNLAELGIGISIGYILYKPLYEHDQTKINEIISVMGYLYRWIGLVILGAGIVVSIFLPFIFPDNNTGFRSSLVYFAYYSFLASSLIGYFINYRQNLLSVDQRNYVVTAYYQSATIIKTLIQMASAYYTRNYYLWITIELVFGIIYSMILNWKINSTYPWLKAEIKLGKQLFKKYPEVIKYTKQIFLHKISGFAQFQMTPILIYAFTSLKTVALYGNYVIIFDKINNLTNNLFGSVSASIGNLIAENNKEKTVEIFWELLSLRFVVMAIISFGLLNFTNDFIRMWLGEEYILPNIVLYLLIINQFLSLSRNINDPFLWGAGMFYDIWAPISEAIIYIVVAFIGGHIWGLPGVILGNTISLLIIIGIWKPYFLFKKDFHLPLKLYIFGWSKITIYYIISIVSTYILLKNYIQFIPNNWGELIIYVFAATITFAILFVGFYYIFSSNLRKGIKRTLKRS
ncbi:lipopolysaccharide biosynthesis protein [Bacteroides salyersiae]|uniref:lipopolysaccharide biosynthesis protein n=1 Tax=Bacteroides salyersiae TaxID=291644 RepID=UPI0032C0F84A